MRVLRLFCGITLLLFSPILGFAATVLTFGTTSAGVPLPAGYGDRAPATPNISVSYFAAPSDLRLWSSGYGSLSGVLYNEPEENSKFGIRFVADPGFLITLSSFQLAGWPSTDYSSGVDVRVLQDGVAVFSQTDFLVKGSSAPRFSQVDPAATGTEVILEINVRLGKESDNIGLGNVVFSQSRVVKPPVDPTIPEPSSMLLLLGGGVALAIPRVLNRKRLG